MMHDRGFRIAIDLARLGSLTIAGHLLVTGVATAASPIVQFPIPTPAIGATAIAAGPDGDLWFTELANRIGRMTPAGDVTEFSLPVPSDVRATALCPGPDGNVWFIVEGSVGRITPLGVITLFPASGAGLSIAAGPDGNLWFAEPGWKIGRMTPAGVLTEFQLPNGHIPVHITAGPDGNLWFTVAVLRVSPRFLMHSFIDRITPDGIITEFAIPIVDVNPFGITSGPDGDLWFTAEQSFVGRVTPSGVMTMVRAFHVASGPDSENSGFPRSIVRGPDGNLWFTDAGRVVRMTPNFAMTSFPTPTPTVPPVSTTVSDVTAGPDGSLWFTEYSGQGNRIDKLPAGASEVGVVPLFWRQTKSGELGMWQIDGSLLRSEKFLAGPGLLDWAVAGVGDVDGNNTPDLVWRNTVNGDVALWLMDGTTVVQTVSVASAVPLTWEIVSVSDFDADGSADVLWRDRLTGSVAVWLMQGTTVRATELVALNVPLAWQIAGVGDTDGDGASDLVWRDEATGDVAVWLLKSGTVKSALRVAAGVPLSWHVAGVGDLDGDRRADLVWYSAESGSVAVWLMDGSTVTAAPIIAASVPSEWRIAKVMDADGDRRADLIWRHDAPQAAVANSFGTVAVWLMNGSAIIGTPAIQQYEEYCPVGGCNWQIQ